MQVTTEKLNRKIRQRRAGGDEDREMKECLERLKVWQTENLMAPCGMDRFAETPEEKKRGTIMQGRQ